MDLFTRDELRDLRARFLAGSDELTRLVRRRLCECLVVVLKGSVYLWGGGSKRHVCPDVLVHRLGDRLPVYVRVTHNIALARSAIERALPPGVDELRVVAGDDHCVAGAFWLLDGQRCPAACSADTLRRLFAEATAVQDADWDNALLSAPGCTAASPQSYASTLVPRAPEPGHRKCALELAMDTVTLLTAEIVRDLGAKYGRRTNDQALRTALHTYLCDAIQSVIGKTGLVVKREQKVLLGDGNKGFMDLVVWLEHARFVFVDAAHSHGPNEVADTKRTHYARATYCGAAPLEFFPLVGWATEDDECVLCLGALCQRMAHALRATLDEAEALRELHRAIRRLFAEADTLMHEDWLTALRRCRDAAARDFAYLRFMLGEASDSVVVVEAPRCTVWVRYSPALAREPDARETEQRALPPRVPSLPAAHSPQPGQPHALRSPPLSPAPRRSLLPPPVPAGPLPLPPPRARTTPSETLPVGEDGLPPRRAILPPLSR